MNHLYWFRGAVGVSAALLVCALLGLNWLLERSLREAIQVSTEIANQAFARAFINQKWDTIRPMLGIDGGVVDPRANPDVREIDARVRGFARGTDLVKVKIYDARGLTLYSSEVAQIGEDKSRNPGFLGAIRGRTVSELTFRGRFGSFDGELFSRDLVSSYVPVRGSTGVEAVVEIYTDRTAAIDSAERQRHATMLWGGSLALGLFAAFVWFVRRMTLRLAAEAAERKNALDQAAGGAARMREAEMQSSGLLAGIAHEFSFPLEALERALGERSGTGAVDLASARSAALALRNRCAWVDLLASKDLGGAEDVPGAADPAECARSATDALAPRAQCKGLDLEVQFGPGSCPPVSSGDTELTALLEALLSDAIDATDEGFVHLKVNPTPEGVQVDIIDSGRPGSASSSLASGAGRDTGGSAYPQPGSPSTFRRALALGLVTRCGGTLRASAAPGVGNWVTVTLPLAQGAGAGDRARPSAD